MNIMSADDDYIESNEIEILGEDVNGVEGFCTYKITDAAKLAYDEITTLRQQVKDMEWISVDDRLPEQGGLLLSNRGRLRHMHSYVLRT